MKHPKSILTFSKPHSSVMIHPTQKPIELLEWLIKTYTNEGDLVLDNCCGSGSTGVACMNTNRRFIGIELDEKYLQIAKERLGINDVIQDN
jgi:site-specific DNA-methyltransferase (adenine-specific)